MTAGTGIIGAKMQSGAINRGTQLQTNAANYAADKAAESSASTERFLREQAQAKWKADETANRANYDQWAAREKRLGSVGDILGYGPREIPAYVPSPDPNLGPQPQLTPQGPQSVGNYLNPQQPPVSTTMRPGSVQSYMQRRRTA